MHELPAALAPLAAYRQFILYRLDQDPFIQSKVHKRPIDYRTGRMPVKGQGGAHDPSIWLDTATAFVERAKYGPEYGVGFVLTPADPFFLIDIDSQLIDIPGEAPRWSDWATWLCTRFGGAAIEVSQSGRGLHIIGSGTCPNHGCKSDYGFDLYTSFRFIALTGSSIVGDASTRHDAALLDLLPYLTAAQPTDGADWTDEPVESYGGPEDDEDLLRIACRSMPAAARFGAAVTATFEQLWSRDVDALAACYPSDANAKAASPYDNSRVDAALAQHLAFWTGNNCERIRELMNRSALRRDKWDDRPEYVERTILKACGLQKKWPEKRDQQHPTPGPGQPTTNAAGEVVIELGLDGNDPEDDGLPEQYVGVQRQRQLFEGMTYVELDHAILVPGGRMLKPDQFRVMFGGYSFQLDPTNQRVSRNAWEAFTESQLFRFPRAERTCFDPLSAPGALLDRGGERIVNQWQPAVVAREPGDVSRFLNHMRLLLPNESDRGILMAYLAAVVQHPGVKFQWCPLLQGTPGNGKTLFTRCVSEAVGHRYTHMPRASEFADGKFNDWLYGNLLIGVEDIYVPERKAHMLEALKPMITGEFQEIEGKGIKKAHREICANFILNCNPKDGLRKTDDDRRIAVFYTAQQTPADLLRDGMTDAYFYEMYQWLKHGGYAAVTDYLHTYEIPHALNPANGWKAPATSSTAEAIEVGRGNFEQEILERIEQGAVGFAGGWISSTYVGYVAKELGLRMAPRRIADVLQSLGYIKHPALRDGRTTAPILPDACKPRLYVKRDHLAAQLTDPAGVQQAYTAAQLPLEGAPSPTAGTIAQEVFKP